MTRSQQGKELLELDPEINKTIRKKKKERERMAMENINEEVRRPFDYLHAPDVGNNSCIVLPPSDKIVRIDTQMLQYIGNNILFKGSLLEDPVEHIDKFSKLCATLGCPNDENFKLRLFPNTLSEKAMDWLNNEPKESIRTWEDLVNKFLRNFFPPSKTFKLRNDITNFTQGFDESLPEAWDRFISLIKKCPHHGLNDGSLLQSFLNGADREIVQNFLAAAGGDMSSKDPSELLKLLETLAKGTSRWITPRKTNKSSKVFKVDKTDQ